MKYLKIIGLAALAAMALMAVVAASASANAKVCSTSGVGESCGSGGAHGNVYNGAISATNVGNVTLTVTNSSGSVINTVTCTSSAAGGNVTNGATGTGVINKLTFTSCNSNICGAVHATTNAATAPNWASTATTEKAGTVNTNGTMDVTNPTGTFSCSFFGIQVNCHYTAASAQVGIDGSDTDPLITAKGVTLTGSGSNASVCGTSAHWTGTYTVSSPKSLFIV